MLLKVLSFIAIGAFTGSAFAAPPTCILNNGPAGGEVALKVVNQEQINGQTETIYSSDPIQTYGPVYYIVKVTTNNSGILTVTLQNQSAGELAIADLVTAQGSPFTAKGAPRLSAQLQKFDSSGFSGGNGVSCSTP